MKTDPGIEGALELLIPVVSLFWVFFVTFMHEQLFLFSPDALQSYPKPQQTQYGRLCSSMLIFSSCWSDEDSGSRQGQVPTEVTPEVSALWAAASQGFLQSSHPSPQREHGPFGNRAAPKCACWENSIPSAKAYGNRLNEHWPPRATQTLGSPIHCNRLSIVVTLPLCSVLIWVLQCSFSFLGGCGILCSEWKKHIKLRLQSIV